MMIIVEYMCLFFTSVYITLPIFLISIPITKSIDFSTTDIHISCLNARTITDSANQYCPYVNWFAANIYASSNFTYYNPGEPISEDDQRSYAQYLYSEFSESSKGALSSQCSEAIRRLACVQAFPLCPDFGLTISGVSYLQPCKLQCSQVNSLCRSKLSINCNSYPSSSCGLYIDPSYFVLPPNLGPYGPIAVIYIVVFTCWLAMTFYWNYLVLYPFKTTALPICRAVASIPYIKIIVLSFGVSFWVTCTQWQECSFWLGVALLNSQLIYDAGQMIILILVSKGWSITTTTLDAVEWRNMILLVASFYVANAILIVLQAGTLSSESFLIAIGILYGMVYLYILYNTMINVKVLRRIAGMFTPAMPPDIIGPSISRYLMYICFLILVFISMSMEIVAHALLSSGSPIWIVLLVYEISNVLIFLTIGYIYRPREHSPYFFLVPVRITDERMRTIPIIEAYDEATEPVSNFDIELAALLGQSGSEVETNIPRKVIMIKNPDSSVSVGVA